MLHTTELGESGSRVVFCHGLFGQGRNFTAAGKALAQHHRVTLVDMPDHGRSPWSDRFDYVAAADQVAELLTPDDAVALVGHSMGGKTAMLTALRHSGLVERLVVVDVAPVPYEHAGTFARYMTAMRAIDLDALDRRGEADAALVEAVPDPVVRGFLLQNLRRDDDRWRWQLNLELLARDLDAITDWPEDALAGDCAVRRAGALGGRRGLGLRAPPRVRRRHGSLVPAQPPGHGQGRRPLGAQRAAGGLPRGAPAVRRRVSRQR